MFGVSESQGSFMKIIFGIFRDTSIGRSWVSFTASSGDSFRDSCRIFLRFHSKIFPLMHPRVPAIFFWYSIKDAFRNFIQDSFRNSFTDYSRQDSRNCNTDSSRILPRFSLGFVPGISTGQASRNSLCDSIIDFPRHLPSFSRMNSGFFY